MKQFKTIRDLIDASVTQQELEFKTLNERETIASVKLKGDISYKSLGKFGDRNVIELMIVNGQRKAVAIRDFRRTAIILNIEEFEEMQKVMKRIKLP